jgi:hypothetical protein
MLWSRRREAALRRRLERVTRGAAGYRHDLAVARRELAEARWDLAEVRRWASAIDRGMAERERQVAVDLRRAQTLRGDAQVLLARAEAACEMSLHEADGAIVGLQVRLERALRAAAGYRRELADQGHVADRLSTQLLDSLNYTPDQRRVLGLPAVAAGREPGVSGD